MMILDERLIQRRIQAQVVRELKENEADNFFSGSRQRPTGSALDLFLQRRVENNKKSRNISTSSGFDERNSGEKATSRIPLSNLEQDASPNCLFDSTVEDVGSNDAQLSSVHKYASYVVNSESVFADKATRPSPLCAVDQNVSVGNGLDSTVKVEIKGHASYIERCIHISDFGIVISSNIEKKRYLHLRKKKAPPPSSEPAKSGGGKQKKVFLLNLYRKSKSMECRDEGLSQPPFFSKCNDVRGDLMKCGSLSSCRRSSFASGYELLIQKPLGSIIDIRMAVLQSPEDLADISDNVPVYHLVVGIQPVIQAMESIHQLKHQNYIRLGVILVLDLMELQRLRRNRRSKFFTRTTNIFVTIVSGHHGFSARKRVSKSWIRSGFSETTLTENVTSTAMQSGVTQLSNSIGNFQDTC
ncbi:hypothetical protein ACET3Z_029075 [Daucus carota]